MGRIYQYLGSEPFAQSRQEEIERALKAFWLPFAVERNSTGDITPQQQQIAHNAVLALEAQAQFLRQQFQLGSAETTRAAAPMLNETALSAIAQMPERQRAGTNGTHVQTKGVVMSVPILELGGDDYLFDDGD